MPLPLNNARPNKLKVEKSSGATNKLPTAGRKVSVIDDPVKEAMDGEGAVKSTVMRDSLAGFALMAFKGRSFDIEFNGEVGTYLTRRKPVNHYNQVSCSVEEAKKKWRRLISNVDINGMSVAITAKDMTEPVYLRRKKDHRCPVNEERKRNIAAFKPPKEENVMSLAELAVTIEEAIERFKTMNDQALDDQKKRQDDQWALLVSMVKPIFVFAERGGDLQNYPEIMGNIRRAGDPEIRLEE